MKTQSTPKIISFEELPPIESPRGGSWLTHCQTRHNFASNEIFAYLTCRKLELDDLTDVSTLLLSGSNMGAAALLEPLRANRALGKMALSLSPEWAALRKKMDPIFVQFLEHEQAEFDRQRAESEELAKAQREVTDAEIAAKAALDADPAIAAARKRVEEIAEARLKAHAAL